MRFPPSMPPPVSRKDCAWEGALEKDRSAVYFCMSFPSIAGIRIF